MICFLDSPLHPFLQMKEIQPSYVKPQLDATDTIELTLEGFPSLRQLNWSKEVLFYCSATLLEPNLLTRINPDWIFPKILEIQRKSIWTKIPYSKVLNLEKLNRQRLHVTFLVSDTRHFRQTLAKAWKPCSLHRLSRLAHRGPTRRDSNPRPRSPTSMPRPSARPSGPAEPGTFFCPKAAIPKTKDKCRR